MLAHGIAVRAHQVHGWLTTDNGLYYCVQGDWNQVMTRNADVKGTHPLSSNELI